jgi:hypothetical protein
MSDFRSCLLARYEIEKFTSFLDRVLPMVNATGQNARSIYVLCVGSAVAGSDGKKKWKELRGLGARR